MNSHHFDTMQGEINYEDLLIYLCVFVMVLLSVATGIFSWAFVEPDLFM